MRSFMFFVSCFRWAKIVSWIACWFPPTVAFVFAVTKRKNRSLCSSGILTRENCFTIYESRIMSSSPVCRPFLQTAITSCASAVNSQMGLQTSSSSTTFRVALCSKRLVPCKRLTLHSSGPIRDLLYIASCAESNFNKNVIIIIIPVEAPEELGEHRGIVDSFIGHKWPRQCSTRCMGPRHGSEEVSYSVNHKS